MVKYHNHDPIFYSLKLDQYFKSMPVHSFFPYCEKPLLSL